MSGRNPDQPSRKKLEKIAKKLVSKDIQSQTNDLFIIDKEVYDEFFPEIKENIDHSSLSALILKYDLGLHAAELHNVFPTHASKARNFTFLKTLHREYGYHLCYMALRESASENNDNGELVEKMKRKAIELKKSPPSELFTDSPFSSDEDIPQGQGESLGQQEQQEREEQSAKQLDDLKFPISVNTITSREELVPLAEEPIPKLSPRQGRLSAQFDSQVYIRHIETCNCTQCVRYRRSNSDPGPQNQPTSLPRLWSQDSTATNRIDELEEQSQCQTFPSPQEAVPTVKYTSDRVSGDNVDQTSVMTAGYESSVREEMHEHHDNGESDVVSGIDRTRNNADGNNNSVNDDVMTDDETST